MNPTLSEVSRALFALSTELDELELKEAALVKQRLLINQKQKICQEAIEAILKAANGGLYAK